MRKRPKLSAMLAWISILAVDPKEPVASAFFDPAGFVPDKQSRSHRQTSSITPLQQYVSRLDSA
jgi:hypothetical protein